MQTWYNWRVKRSGAGMRIIGTCHENGTAIKNHKRSDIASIELRLSGAVYAIDREGKTVAILSCEYQT